MIRDEILAAMHEAGAGQADEIPRNYEGVIDVFTRFAAITYAAGAKDEREACAKVCDEQGAGHKAMEHYAALTYSGAAHDCAAAIRARGEK